MDQALDAKVTAWRELLVKAIFEGDAKRLTSEFFHPDAVLIGGGRASSGLQEIETAWTHILPDIKGQKYETRHDWITETESGKRIFFKATFWPVEDSTKTTSYLIEMVKSADGKYLIYRDYFAP